MPNEIEHKKKYKENRNVLDHQLSIDNPDCYNWIVTVAFYSALHLVEGALAQYNIHSTSHTARNSMVNMQREFRNIRSKYHVLHTNSIVARYYGSGVNKRKAEEALQYLEDIEKEIGTKETLTLQRLKHVGFLCTFTSKYTRKHIRLMSFHKTFTTKDTIVSINDSIRLVSKPIHISFN